MPAHRCGHQPLPRTAWEGLPLDVLKLGASGPPDLRVAFTAVDSGTVGHCSQAVEIARISKGLWYFLKGLLHFRKAYKFSFHFQSLFLCVFASSAFFGLFKGGRTQQQSNRDQSSERHFAQHQRHLHCGQVPQPRWESTCQNTPYTCIPAPRA